MKFSYLLVLDKGVQAKYFFYFAYIMLIPEISISFLQPPPISSVVLFVVLAS